MAACAAQSVATFECLEGVRRWFAIERGCSGNRLIDSLKVGLQFWTALLDRAGNTRSLFRAYGACSNCGEESTDPSKISSVILKTKPFKPLRNCKDSWQTHLNQRLLAAPHSLPRPSNALRMFVGGSLLGIFSSGDCEIAPLREALAVMLRARRPRAHVVRHLVCKWRAKQGR